MAWRIDEHVVRGEIDNRTRGRVTGRIWLAGRDEPIEIELEGNPWRDLAGHVLEFTNPDPKPGDLSGFATLQQGSAGDITASRKVKVPDCSMEELLECYAAKTPFPWHWGNSLYLEWFSATNGRVVIESAAYQLTLDTEPAWAMSEEDEAGQLAANAGTMMDYMGGAGGIIGEVKSAEEDEDAPTSLEEAQADGEDARMQLLLDRMTARMEREGIDGTRFERIYEEERSRLMRERGESEPELTADEVAARQEWIREMNAITGEAMADLEAEKWKGGNPPEEERHPLVEECSDLAVELYKDVAAAGWIPEGAQEEYPLRELVHSASSASAKLAGALGMADRPDEWPPDSLIAGHVLVRLKKARGYLRDAMRALDSAEEEGLATPKWRHHVRLKVINVLAETQDLIRDVRESLEVDDDDDLGIF